MDVFLAPDLRFEAANNLQICVHLPKVIGNTAESASPYQEEKPAGKAGFLQSEKAKPNCRTEGCAHKPKF